MQDEFPTQLNENTGQMESATNEQVETGVEAMESKQYGTGEQGKYFISVYSCSIMLM